MAGKIFIVGTPIGNLGDITYRALETLKSVDLILCEDTRRTIKLLNYFEIKKPLQSYHRHTKIEKTAKIIELLELGKNLALVSDSGTPGLADPGNKLIEDLLKVLPDAEIIPIPGASAITALASAAGINMDEFLFLGFPPQKKGRQTFFKDLREIEYPVMLYESPHRIIKTLESLAKELPDAHLVAGKELTKVYEKIYRGAPSEVLAEVSKDGARGEYTLIISKTKL